MRRRTLLILISVAASARAAEPLPEAAEFFEKQVRPLLVARCLQCHNDQKAKGALRLTAREHVLVGGLSGPAAAPAKPDESLLVKAIRYADRPRMPPKEKLPDGEIAILTRWVALGLPWPAAAPAGLPASGITAEQRRFWSFQPIREPALPNVQDSAWPRTPIDRFVLARLESKGLRPAPEVDKLTLLRRLTFDLIGLPPTPEEVDAFLADSASDAVAKVVERLLASPAYGERWGRYWLDVAHYADTAGETADYPVPAAYRYRNYVIDSFNADKPYDQFVREQIAGDLLPKEGTPEQRDARIIATGFLAVTRRFGFDPQNYQHLTIEDTIDTLGKAVLGLTVACARCHDHKFDPVTQADYYALYGIFASTRYPFPGSEERKRSADFVLLSKMGETAYAVADGAALNAKIHKRGDPLTPGAEVPRRFVDILGGDPLPADAKGSGRLELAGWLTRPTNPLTARVLVNRIWQHHFGQGLVRSASNFGKQGRPPTHPELLDYLAARFIAGGWSVKALHRQIVLSRVYQLGAGEAVLREADLDNEWLARHDRGRLDAEAIRDALLAVAGNLDRAPGGPHPFPPANTWNWTQHDPFRAVYDTDKRSVYLMVQRTKRHPFLALFDGADPNASTAQRGATTVPTQALFFLNSPFVKRQAERFAERLMKAAPTDPARLNLAHRLALGRPATAEEVRAGEAYLARYRAEAGVPAAQRDALAWTSYARALFGSNEFIYVD